MDLILALQILATVSIGLGAINIIGGVEDLGDYSGGIRTVAVLVGIGIVIVLWTAPFAGLIIVMGVACVRKLGILLKELWSH